MTAGGRRLDRGPPPRRRDRREIVAVHRSVTYDVTRRVSLPASEFQARFRTGLLRVVRDFAAGESGQWDEVFFHGAGEFFTLWSPGELYAMGEGWEGPQAACRKLSGDQGKGKRK